MARVNYCRTRGDVLDELVLDIKSRCYAMYGSVWNAGESMTGGALSRNKLYARVKNPEELTIAELRELRTALKMDKNKLLEQLGEVI